MIANCLLAQLLSEGQNKPKNDNNNNNPESLQKWKYAISCSFYAHVWVICRNIFGVRISTCKLFAQMKETWKKKKKKKSAMSVTVLCEKKKRKKKSVMSVTGSFLVLCVSKHREQKTKITGRSHLYLTPKKASLFTSPCVRNLQLVSKISRWTSSR